MGGSLCCAPATGRVRVLRRYAALQEALALSPAELLLLHEAFRAAAAAAAASSGGGSVDARAPAASAAAAAASPRLSPAALADFLGLSEDDGGGGAFAARALRSLCGAPLPPPPQFPLY